MIGNTDAQGFKFCYQDSYYNTDVMYVEKILQEDAMSSRVNSDYPHPMLKLETSFPL